MSWGATDESILQLDSEVHSEAISSREEIAKKTVTEIIERVRCIMREELLSISLDTPRFGGIKDRNELLDCIRQGVREEISTALEKRQSCFEGASLAETVALPGMVPRCDVHTGTDQSSKAANAACELSKRTVSLPGGDESITGSKGTITLPQEENAPYVGPMSSLEASYKPDDWITKYARGYLADSVLKTRHSDEPLVMHSAYEAPSLYSSFRRHGRSQVTKLVKSRLFNVGASVFVLLSAGLIGAQVDYMAKNIRTGLCCDRLPWPYVAGDVFFVVVFTTEILLRIVAHGWQLYQMQGWQWYVFDTVLVALHLIETFLSFIHVSHVSVLRMVRIMRLFRIVRVVRVLHLIREFRTIIISIGKALRPFFLAFFLFMLLLYIVGIYVLQIVLDNYSGSSDAFYANPMMQKYWPSLGMAILSLFQALLGGVDWENVLDPLMHGVSPWMAPFFMIFIAFSTFVVLNLITGIFLDLTLGTLNEIKDRELINKMTELFLAADDNQSGFICYPEFEQQLKNPLLEKYFQEIDMHFSEAKGLFNLLDTDNTGRVDAQDFVMGCLRLRGNARALEMATMASHVQQSFVTVKGDLTGIWEVLVEIVDLLIPHDGNSGSSRHRQRYHIPTLSRRTRPSLLVP